MNKACFVISAVTGLLFAVCAAAVLFFVDRSMMYVAAPAGLLFAAALYLFMVVHMGGVERKYQARQSQIDHPVLHTANAALNLEKKVLAVRLCCCEDCMVMLSTEVKGGLVRTIRYEDVAAWETASPNRLTIVTSDQEKIVLQTAHAELMEALRTKVGLELAVSPNGKLRI